MTLNDGVNECQTRGKSTVQERKKKLGEWERYSTYLIIEKCIYSDAVLV